MSLPNYNELMELCETNEAFYFVDHRVGAHIYRVFTYRMASYTDFLLPSALECRGHTFILFDDGDTELMSLPMEKFFNDGENPFVMDLDWSQVVDVADKLDGSLISTCSTPTGFVLKSKTSFTSQQARDATALLNTEKYWEFNKLLHGYRDMDATVNMEYCAPDNQIVLGYAEPSLKVLNIRCNRTGEYLPLHDSGFYLDQIAAPIKVADMDEFVKSVAGMTGIEGFVFTFKNGLKVKKKTAWYSALHLQKDQINNPRRLFESVINEQSDDLKALFVADPLAIEKIEAMEEKGRALFNHLHKLVGMFHDEHHLLSRKDYAIAAKAALENDGVFGLAMNLYTGRDMGLREFLTKNSRQYGIVDTTSDKPTE